MKKKPPVVKCERLGNSGADARIRTADLLITNQLLYRLSYIGPIFFAQQEPSII